MARSKIRHGAVLKCDMPKCDGRFTTYSIATLCRKQAASAGWSRVNARKVPLSDGTFIKSGKVDLCPSCKPKPIMGGADVPK